MTEVGFKLSQVLRRKLQKTEVERAESHLVGTTFDLIEAEQYDPAIRLLEFSLRPPMKFKDVRGRYICIVNLAQAYKWSGNSEKCKRILGDEDWSAASADFLLAVAVLSDKFDEAEKQMRQIGPDGEPGQDDYDKWPLFKEFRKSDLFLKAYKDIFKTEMKTERIPEELLSGASKDSAEPDGKKNVGGSTGRCGQNGDRAAKAKGPP